MGELSDSSVASYSSKRTLNITAFCFTYYIVPVVCNATIYTKNLDSSQSEFLFDYAFTLLKEAQSRSYVISVLTLAKLYVS